MEATEAKYSWPAWWGGKVSSDNPPMIATQVQELRRRIGGLKAKKADGVKFLVKSSKDLMEKLSDALDELGMIATVVAQEHTSIPEVEFVNRSTGDKQPGTGAYVSSEVWVGCSDGSYLVCVGSGQGLDRDDKAGGKASTYAWKDALLKGLSIGEEGLEDTDNESGHGADRRRKTKSSESKPKAAGARTDGSGIYPEDAGLTDEQRLTQQMESAGTLVDLTAAASQASKVTDPGTRARLGALYQELKTKFKK